MRLGDLGGEALRGITSGTARVGMLGTCFFAVLALCVSVDTLAVLSIVDEAREFRDAGAGVIVVTAPGSIDGRVCEAMSVMPGVEAAGAVRAADHPLAITVLPRSPVDLYESSPGFREMFDAGSVDADGVLVTDEVANAVLGSGSRTMSIVTDRGVMHVGGTFAYPSDGRRAGFGWTAIAPTDASGLFDECWLSAWPLAPRIRALARLVISATATSSPHEQPDVAQLNQRFGESFDGYARHMDRVTRYVPIVSMLAGMALAALAVRIRRLELAARLHDGFSRSALCALTMLETVCWLLPPAVMAVGLTALLVTGAPIADASAIVGTASVTAISTVCAGLFGTVAALSRVRERDLFAYFADR